ncbi:hypothetical protein [Candidatus Pantoea deserta]|uniref:hypothetical protein n=1 Tax=Candidatus Pantoea deserta TaxID=1869313 RepID=UPI001319C417|nr:hypothetical protein [Pantoea deserta]
MTWRKRVVTDLFGNWLIFYRGQGVLAKNIAGPWRGIAALTEAARQTATQSR